jgi:hypothetical protein
MLPVVISAGEQHPCLIQVTTVRRSPGSTSRSPFHFALASLRGSSPVRAELARMDVKASFDERDDSITRHGYFLQNIKCGISVNALEMIRAAGNWKFDPPRQ